MIKITNKLKIESIDASSLELGCDETIIKEVIIEFRFFGIQYIGTAKFIHLINEDTYSFSLSGDSLLFDSFEEQIQLHISKIKFLVLKWARETYDDVVIPEPSHQD